MTKMASLVLAVGNFKEKLSENLLFGRKMGPRWVGDDGDDDDDGGIIFPGHPGPIPNVPRDNISRKGIPSLRQAKHTCAQNIIGAKPCSNRTNYGWRAP